MGTAQLGHRTASPQNSHQPAETPAEVTLARKLGLGLIAALAADAPEITSAVVALARGQASVGAGVVIGSNVFNLAALLGLAAVVAGWIGFHRRVVVLSGVPAVWVAAVCLLTVAAVVAPAAGLALAAVVLVPYVVVLGMRRVRMERLRLPAGWVRWLIAAVHEEEAELAEAIRPRRGTGRDAAAALAALITVVGASTVMEVTATTVGRRHAVPDIVTGGRDVSKAYRRHHLILAQVQRDTRPLETAVDTVLELARLRRRDVPADGDTSTPLDPMGSELRRTDMKAQTGIPPWADVAIHPDLVAGMLRDTLIAPAAD